MSAKDRGYLRTGTLGGIPILVHWSLPAWACAAFVVFFPDFQRAAWMMLGYVSIIVLHEAAHAGAAIFHGLKVYSVNLSGGGGLCRMQKPAGVRDSALIFGAGVLAQVLLLVLALTWIGWQGWPRSVAGSSLALCFTLLNAFIILSALIPHTTRDGYASDGLVLWQLYLHRFHGGPHPHPAWFVAAPEQSPVFDPQTRLASMPRFVPDGFRHGIEILNDATTPMVLVKSLLERYLGLSETKAVALMLKIHNEGGVLYPLSDGLAAEKVAAAICAESLEQGHRLTCRAVSLPPVSH